MKDISLYPMAFVSLPKFFLSPVLQDSETNYNPFLFGLFMFHLAMIFERYIVSFLVCLSIFQMHS